MAAKKIVLVQPPFYRLFDDAHSYNEAQLSLGYLAGAIGANTSWEPVIYNADFNRNTFYQGHSASFSFKATEGFANFTANLGDPQRPIWQEVRQTLREIEPAAVGITTTTQNFRSACMVARIAKEIDPGIAVIVGGPHCSMVGTGVLDVPAIDVGVIGEGEVTIIELLDALEKGRDLAAVQGTVFRTDGEKMAAPPRELIADLDLLPYPHLAAQESLIDYPLYPKSAFYSVLSSRGCPYRCSFCGSSRVWGGKVRLRSPENVLQELESLQRMGLRSVRFADDTFGWNRGWTEALCDGILTRCAGLKWKCEVHVSLVNDELLAMMKRAGCHMIELGVESGDNRILQAVHKKITVEQALDACRLVKKHGMELQAYLIAGFPQETEESLARTREVIRKINGYVWLSAFSPFPGTDLYDYCRSEGILAADFDPTLQNFQNPTSFCKGVPQERFRETVLEMMREVDVHNSVNHLGRAFSFNTLWRVQEMGLRNAFMKGVEILLSKGLISRAFRSILP